jgi:hypothetical protein
MATADEEVNHAYAAASGLVRYSLIAPKELD